MMRGVKIAIVLMISSLFAIQAQGLDERKCFSPVVCTDDRTAQPRWRQVISGPQCHDGDKANSEITEDVGAAPCCERAVDELKKAMDEMKKNMTENLEEMKKSILASMPGSCPVFYNGKCYWAVMRGRWSTNFTGAERLCKERGGRLAEILDAPQMDLMIGFVRNWLSSQVGDSRGMWVAGKFDSTNHETDLSYIRWAAGYPKQDSALSRILLVSTMKPSTSGFQNMNPTTNKHFGAFCQNED